MCRNFKSKIMSKTNMTTSVAGSAPRPHTFASAAHSNNLVTPNSLDFLIIYQSLSVGSRCEETLKISHVQNKRDDLAASVVLVGLALRSPILMTTVL